MSRRSSRPWRNTEEESIRQPICCGQRLGAWPAPSPPTGRLAASASTPQKNGTSTVASTRCAGLAGPARRATGSGPGDHRPSGSGDLPAFAVLDILRKAERKSGFETAKLRRRLGRLRAGATTGAGAPGDRPRRKRRNNGQGQGDRDIGRRAAPGDPFPRQNRVIQAQGRKGCEQQAERRPNFEGENRQEGEPLPDQAPAYLSAPDQRVVEGRAGHGVEKERNSVRRSPARSRTPGFFASGRRPGRTPATAAAE